MATFTVEGFRSGVVYFESLGGRLLAVYPDGSAPMGNKSVWRCMMCLEHLADDETPEGHAKRRHVRAVRSHENCPEGCPCEAKP